MDVRELNELRSVEELAAYQGEVRSRMVELDKEHDGLPFPDEARGEYAELRKQDDEISKRIAELKARQKDLADRAGNGHVEATQDVFRTVRPGAARGDDIYDLSTIGHSLTNPERAAGELRDRAKRAIELAAFPHTDKQRAQAHVEELLERLDTPNGTLSRHILETGSPLYKRAFGKHLSGKPLTSDEARAMSLTGSAGGFAVPFDLDPTIIPTSNGSVNPFRQISRVVQISGDEWRGISSGAITASYAAEATEATDNSPTLAQPTISTEKAQAFIPFSIEIGMDWNGFQAEMGRLLQEAKDDLEATKFALGSGTNEPQGVITGATTVYTAADTDSLTVADLYGLETALPPRFRPNARIVMNRAIAQKFRQFDISTQSSVWQDNLRIGLDNNPQGAYGSSLLGYPVYESSAMSSAMTTGQLIAVIGDFRYYVIVDRIGLTVELIPHLFGTTANYPTGQRGLYAYWRNSAEVISAGAFRVLKLA